MTKAEQESVDEFMVRTGVFDKLLSQIEQGAQRTDWEAQLDELRSSPCDRIEGQKVGWSKDCRPSKP